jgi:uncharacterized membrane protein YqhA
VTAPETDPPVEAGRRRSLGEIRYLALLAVGGLSATTVATFGVAIAKTVSLADKTIGGGWRDELIIVAVLEAIDTYLLAVVQLIVVVGLYELFIGDLDLPPWLEARSLDDLKKPLIDVLVVFVAIKGIERFLVADEPVDALYSVGAVALLIASLTAFRTLTAQRGTKRPSSG